MHDKSIQLVFPQIFGLEKHIKIEGKLKGQGCQYFDPLINVVKQIESEHNDLRHLLGNQLRNHILLDIAFTAMHLVLS